MSTVALVGAARPTAAITCFSAALSPTIWCRTSTAFLSERFSSRSRRWSSALRRLTRTRSLANGFSMKSNAPFLVASTAVLIVPWPETTTTGSASFMRAQALEHFDAVHARHLDVEQDEVGRLALGQREPLLAGRGADELVAFVLERHPQRIADRGFVVDDQDAGFGH